MPRLLLALTACLASCDRASPAAWPEDAGVDADDGAEDAGPPLPAPDPPAAPALPAPLGWPCPPGWTSVVVEAGEPWEGAACEPPPRVECEGATAQHAGDASCQPVGTACPADGERFLAEEAIRELAPRLAGPVRYVDPQARPRGDGTREAPFRTLDEAIRSRLPAATILALSVGDHPGDAELWSAGAIVGACPQETLVYGQDGTQPVLRLLSPGEATLANVSLEGDAWGILVGPGEGEVRLASVVVRRAVDFGVAVTDRARGVRLDRLVVRGITTPEWEQASGVYLFESAARGGRLVVEESDAIGLMAIGAGEVDLEDVVVRGEPPETEHRPGLTISDGATAHVRRAVLDGCSGNGAELLGSLDDFETTLSLEDVAVRSVGKNGVYAAGNVLLEAARLWVSDTVKGGIVVFPFEDRLQGRAHLTDVVVWPPAAGEDLAGGVHLNNFATAELAGVLVLGARGAGLLVGTAGTARVEDLVVRGGEPLFGAGLLPGDPPLTVLVPGGGAIVVEDAELELTRAALLDTSVAGLTAHGSQGTTARAFVDDLTVRGVPAAAMVLSGQGDPDLPLVVAGTALQGLGDAEVAARRVEVSGQEGHAVAATGDGSSEPSVIVDDLACHAPGELPAKRFGTTVLAGLGARLELTRAALEDGRVSAVASAGWDREPQTRIRLFHTRVDGVLPAPCGGLTEEDSQSCVVNGASHAGGIGLVARGGGWLEARDVEVRGAAVAGVVIAEDARVEARRTLITGNEVGIAVLVPEYDLELLSDDVYVFGNRTDMSTATLPLPSTGRLTGMP